MNEHVHELAQGDIARWDKDVLGQKFAEVNSFTITYTDTIISNMHTKYGYTKGQMALNHSVELERFGIENPDLQMGDEMRSDNE